MNFRFFYKLIKKFLLRKKSSKNKKYKFFILSQISYANKTF